MKIKPMWVALNLTVITLVGCSAEQVATMSGAMNSMNQGLSNASAYTTPPPSFYQQTPINQQQVQENRQIQQSPPPWAYPNQPIGTCTKDTSTGVTRIICN